MTPSLYAVLLALMPALTAAHGRLTVPRPRENNNCNVQDADPLNRCIDDIDGPVNLNNWPLADPLNHPEGQSLVCRVANGYSTVPTIDITSGTDIILTWSFTALHPGDGGLYLSYINEGEMNTQNMMFFKIANFPQQRLNSGQSVPVHLPSWLPPGRAVLRWDWYATHNPPVVEFYTNCVDVNVVSTSTINPATIPSYKIESGSTTNPHSYSPSVITDMSISPFCFDCTASDWRRHYTAFGGQDGPQCVTGVNGNCCDIINNYLPSAESFTAAAPQQDKGFFICKDLGSTGPPPGGPLPSPSPTTTPGAGRVVISEIMYNPCAATAGNTSGQGSDNDFEFFEICNPGNVDFNLEGAVVSQAVSFTFPAGATLSAGEYAIVAIKATSFTSGPYALPSGTQVWQWTSGNLVNRGGQLVISTSDGVTLDSVHYDDDAPWDVNNAATGGDHDGGCRSLELDDVTADNGDSNNVGGHWSASCTVFGTPARPNDVFPCGAPPPQASPSPAATSNASNEDKKTMPLAVPIGVAAGLAALAAMAVIVRRRRQRSQAQQSKPQRRNVVLV